MRGAVGRARKSAVTRFLEPRSARALRLGIATGETPTLEWKRSTGELREAMQTPCAFANGDRGRVIFGIDQHGEILGPQVSDQALHEITACKGRFEPPLAFALRVVEVAPGRSVIVLRFREGRVRPFTRDGRAYESLFPDGSSRIVGSASTDR